MVEMEMPADQAGIFFNGCFFKRLIRGNER